MSGNDERKLVSARKRCDCGNHVEVIKFDHINLAGQYVGENATAVLITYRCIDCHRLSVYRKRTDIDNATEDRLV